MINSSMLHRRNIYKDTTNSKKAQEISIESCQAYAGRRGPVGVILYMQKKQNVSCENGVVSVFYAIIKDL